MDIQVTVFGATEHVHGEILGPGGFFRNTSSVALANGGLVFNKDFFNRSVSQGTWQFRAWRRNANGTFTDVAQVNLGVA